MASVKNAHIAKMMYSLMEFTPGLPIPMMSTRCHSTADSSGGGEKSEVTYVTYILISRPVMLWLGKATILVHVSSCLGQVRSTRNQRACMIRCMNVEEARGVC